MNQRNYSWAHLVWNVIGLEVGWLACVLGAAWNTHSLGLVVVLLLAIIHGLIIGRDKVPSAILLALASLAIGFVLDTALIAVGAYEPDRWLLPSPLATIWLLMLWLNFSLALDESLKRLQEHLVFAAILGSIFGPLAYLAASRSGAVHIDAPVSGRLLLISLGWLIAMPLMSAIARRSYQGSFRFRKR